MQDKINVRTQHEKHRVCMQLSGSATTSQSDKRPGSRTSRALCRGGRGRPRTSKGHPADGTRQRTRLKDEGETWQALGALKQRALGLNPPRIKSRHSLIGQQQPHASTRLHRGRREMPPTTVCVRTVMISIGLIKQGAWPNQKQQRGVYLLTSACDQYIKLRKLG